MPKAKESSCKYKLDTVYLEVLTKEELKCVLNRQE